MNVCCNRPTVPVTTVWYPASPPATSKILNQNFAFQSRHELGDVANSAAPSISWNVNRTPKISKPALHAWPAAADPLATTASTTCAIPNAALGMVHLPLLRDGLAD